jgi:hypothetical protein
MLPEDHLPDAPVDMSEHTHGVSEIVATASESITEAVNSRITRANKTPRHLDWFEDRPDPGLHRRRAGQPLPSDDSSDEAAAVIGALLEFMRGTARSVASGGGAPNPWLRATMFEATNREAEGLTPWGDPHPWGR